MGRPRDQLELALLALVALAAGNRDGLQAAPARPVGHVMCQNCGCLANTVVEELTREHDAVVALIRTVGEQVVAGRMREVAATCRAISALLGPHTIVEEDGLFPELYREFPGQLEMLTREHRQVERVLEEADGGVPADLLWPERLRDGLGILRDHILKEQDGVFPAAIISLDGDQWENVAAVRRRAGSALEGRLPAAHLT